MHTESLEYAQHTFMCLNVVRMKVVAIIPCREDAVRAEAVEYVSEGVIKLRLRKAQLAVSKAEIDLSCWCYAEMR